MVAAEVAPHRQHRQIVRIGVIIALTPPKMPFPGHDRRIDRRGFEITHVKVTPKHGQKTRKNSHKGQNLHALHYLTTSFCV